MAKRLRKRAISIALMLTMVFTLFPTTSIIAYAAEDNTEYSLLMDQQEDEIVLESEEVFVTEENEEITDPDESETEDSSILLELEPGMILPAYADDDPPYAQYKNSTTVITFDEKEWYLINYDTSTVTLLAKECVGESKYYSGGDFVEYSQSTVKTAVDNWYNNNITADAKTAVSDGRMFLLTTDQANDITNAEVRKDATVATSSTSGWWLCSLGLTENRAALVLGRSGEVFAGGQSVLTTKGVRPALKLDLSKVVFKSSKNTFSLPTEYTALNDNTKPVITVKRGGTAVTEGAPQIGDVLTVETDATDLVYVWYRGNDIITDAETDTYTLTTDDFGKAIKVTVYQTKKDDGTDYEESNRPTLTSEATAAVEKKTSAATQIAASDITVTKTDKGVSFTAPEPVNTGSADAPVYKYAYGYKTGDATDYTWTDTLPITGLNPGTEYEVVVREKATSDTAAGPVSEPVTVKTDVTVTIGDALIQGQEVEVTIIPATTGVTYKWYIGDSSEPDGEGTKIVPGTGGGKIKIEVYAGTPKTLIGTGTTTTKVKTIADVISGSTTSPVIITLDGPITGGIPIPSGKEVTLEIDGQEVQGDIDVPGTSTLTITDSSNPQKGTVKGTVKANTGTVIIKGGRYDKTPAATEPGTVTIKGGLFKIDPTPMISKPYAVKESGDADYPYEVFCAYDPLTDENKPTITIKRGGNTVTEGSPQTDDVLTAETTATDLIYQWYRDNEPISGATESTYKVTKEDFGKTITVKVSQIKKSDGTYYAEDERPVQNSEATEAVEKSDAHAAEDVEELISALPEAKDITLEDKDAFDSALAAYDELTDDQKELISKEDKKKLTDIASKLAELIIEAATPKAPESAPTYDGSTVTLVTSMEVEGGTVEYAFGTDGTTVPTTGWTKTIPTATDAGDYYIWYRIKTDYTDVTDPICIKVSIEAVTDNKVTVTISSWTYGETANTPVATAAFGADTATFSYSKEKNGTYTVEVPSMPGTYYVKATIAETKNYNGTESEAVEFVIDKIPQKAPEGILGNRIKAGTKEGVITGVDDTMEYSIDDGKSWIHVDKGATTIEGLAAGKVIVRRAETETHKVSEAVTVEIKEYNTELTVYFAEGTDSGTTQYVTYNEKEKRYEHIFTGEKIHPAITVEGGGELLKEGLNYTVSYTDNVNISSGGKVAKVKVTGKGDYTQTKTISFTIVKAALSRETVVANGMIVKAGEKIAPVLYFNGYKLKNSDYTVKSSTGKMTFKTTDKDPSLTFTGKGNFTGELKLPVTVIAKNAKKPSVKVTLQSGTKRIYNGSPQTLTVATAEKAGELTVKSSVDNKILTENVDFVVSYSSNINAGKVTVTVNGVGNYTGSSKKEFYIKPDTAVAKVDSSFADGKGSYEFKKEGVTPAITVTATRDKVATVLTEGIDYKVTYSNNKKVGDKAKYSVTFLGNYKGRKAITGKTFKITTSTLDEAVIVAGDKVKTVKTDKDGISVSFKSEPLVSIGKVKLTKGTDYSVAYLVDGKPVTGSNIKLNKGETSKTITVEITGKGNYVGTSKKTATYKVYKVITGANAVDLSKARIVGKGTKAAVKSQKYTGIAVEPEIDVQIKQNGKWVKVDPSLYTVSYVNNVRRGTASIVINGNGTTTFGSKKSNFKIAKSAMKDAKVGK